jgi:phosphoribosylanthranilate isomerase
VSDMFDPDQVFVKVCGITNAEDALLCAGMGADAVGMIFAASSRRVTRSRAQEIVRRLPADVFTVGVFRDENRERVVEIANGIGLKGVQLHGYESAEDTMWVAERVPGGVIRALPISSPMLDHIDDFGSVRLLVDGPAPGSGETFDWDLLDTVPSHKDFILAGGLTPENVLEAIDQVRPWGVDVASGVESQPGLKDTTKTLRFIKNAKSVRFSQLGPPQPRLPKRTPKSAGVSEIFDWQEDDSWQ